MSQHWLTKPVDTVGTCAHGRLSDADRITCDPIDPVTD
jgi:hypothetical protein